MKRGCVLSALLVAVVAASSCEDPTTTGVAPSPGPFVGSASGDAATTGLLQCTPLPLTSTKQTVGPAGGTMQIGPHVLVIPPGALAAPVVLQGVMAKGSVNAVKFKPSGLTFLTPAYLTLSYANCNVLGLTYSREIAYTTDSLAILYYVPSSDYLLSTQVTAAIGHFSNYAVAW